MHSTSHGPLPFPLALIASALLLAAALMLLGLAALIWRRTARLVPIRARRIVTAWRVCGTAFALWGLGLLGLVGLSLAYPFNGRQVLVPPGAGVAVALEVASYATVPAGVVVLAAGRFLLHRAYRA